MKPQTYARGIALRVTWVDSTQSHGWLYTENPPVHIERIVTQGFAVNTSPDGLNMTSTISKLGGVLGLVTIPWACITSIQELEDWNRGNIPRM